MKLTEQIEILEQNRFLIESYGKLELDVLNKINYKFRLDWNYYSNKMEGGTLTKAETRSVMVQNIDIKGKPFKDVAEMQGHDSVVLDVLKIGKGELRISEKRIKDIHKAIMFESDPEKAKQIGKWKTKPNEVINYKGEKYSFSPPDEVAEYLHSALNNLNSDLDAFFNSKKHLHPLYYIVDFHLNYLNIHPFYDGNGRTARILTNLILISCGYPAIIIKDEHKTAYYNILGDIQCYGGDKELLVKFFAQRIQESQKLVIDAIEGKDIEDEDDLDKKLSLLDIELKAIDNKDEIKEILSYPLLKEKWDEWIIEFIDEMILTTQKFDKFYTEPKHILNLYIDNNSSSIRINNIFDYDHLFQVHYSNKPTKNIEKASFTFFTNFGLFKKSGLDSFACIYSIHIEFDKYTYRIYVDKYNSNFAYQNNGENRELYDERMLHHKLSKNEILNEA